MNLTGLTDKQVQEKIRQGKQNISSHKSDNTIGKIILRSTLTIFNLVNLILALMIISVGAYKNLLFLLIAIANTLISIVNGIRAKRTVDKMRLLAEQQPTVIRNGKPRQISSEQIVEGDLLVYSLGDQVIVDSCIEQGIVEVNEAFITGEQDNIMKHQGDTLTSGSFIVSGSCQATATAVGKDNFINKLEQNAHTIKQTNSKLFTLVNNIVKYISFALIPIGALLLWARFNVPDTTTEVAVTSTVAGLISMIPEGLVLLTSSVLALATVRLSRKSVLVQDLYSIETLARVDTIALDKTGTLTTGKMTVHDLIPAKGQSKKALETALMAILSAQDTDNATSIALKHKLLKTAKSKPTEPILEVIPFSSDRKYSGIRTKKATYLMGALEFLTDNPDILAEAADIDKSYRVIAVVKSATPTGGRAGGVPMERSRDMGEAARSGPVVGGHFLPNAKLLGFALLEDEIRPTASKIIQYFYNNDITPKIISGDDLAAVTEIARKVGLRDLKGINLPDIKSPDYDKLVQEYTIFTRVTPAQKKQLIKALRKQGSTVAMTGDGVNDILAMKESDVGIAIGEGSDAARRSAKLVLLKSDFTAVPSIIDEGRQSINNLERSATLFLSKNTYAAILAVLFILIPLEYPFAPLEMSLLNFACIGLPGVILALEKNTARIKDRFVTNILQFSVPTGITVAITMLILAILASNIGFNRAELITTSAIVTFAIDFLLIYSISRPLNLLRTILLGISASIVTLAILIPLTRNFLDFTLLSPDKLLVAGILIAAAYTIFAVARAIMKRLTPRILHRSSKY